MRKGVSKVSQWTPSRFHDDDFWNEVYASKGQRSPAPWNGNIKTEEDADKVFAYAAQIGLTDPDEPIRASSIFKNNKEVVHA